MCLPDIANSFRAPLDRDHVISNRLDAVGGSVSASCKPDLLDTSSAAANIMCSRLACDTSWALGEYLKQASSNTPWTDRLLDLSSSARYAAGSSPSLKSALSQPAQEVFQRMALSFSAPQEKPLVGLYTPNCVFAGGLPTPPQVHCNLDTALVGVAEVPSGERSGQGQRVPGFSAGLSNTSGSKYRGDSNTHIRGRKYAGSPPHDEEGEDEDGDNKKRPKYITSSHSRSKNRISSGSDFACWFFKLDPVKYADCMHVHGRSSDLKYAHLKHHFEKGGVPSEFDKNMSWDEVWATLFPRVLPPENKYYVINDIIIGILEASSDHGDDVSRFLHTLGNTASREAALNRIYGISRDRGRPSQHSNPPSASPPSTATRRNRRGLYIPFDRASKRPSLTPPSSGSNSSYNNTPVTSKEALGSPYSPPLFDSYRLDNSRETNSQMEEVGPVHTDSQSAQSPQPLNPPATASLYQHQHRDDMVREVVILDEHYNFLWSDRELPWPAWFDFKNYYFSHECVQDKGRGVIRVDSIEELTMVYDWHVVGTCHLTLVAQRRHY